MQEFLTNNTVSCNLMSLTGYRTLVILSALMESPKSNDEINECLFNDQYIGEKFSGDTLRIYINNLRAIGCEITRANKTNNQKYTMVSHPFAYDIQKSQLVALSKLYRGLYDKIDIYDVVEFEKFFTKISSFITNNQTKDFLMGISNLKSLDLKIIDELLLHCKNKNEIVIQYNSTKSGLREIQIVADKLAFRSEKLYLWGDNLTHKEYSYFAVDKIKKISFIKHLKSNEKIPTINLVYELYNYGDYKLEENESLLASDKDKLTIEAKSKNEFDLMQKMLNKANDCKVISPDKFKNKLLKKLEAMKKIYEEV